MAQSTVLSNQLIPFVLRGAKLDEAHIAQIIERMPDADYDKLSAALAEVLREEADGGSLQMKNPATGEFATLKSVLFKSNTDSPGSVAVVAFSFTNAAHESLAALFGLVATAFLGHWSVVSIGSSLTVLRSLWTNLSVLRSPQDDHAIALVRTLAILQTLGESAISNAKLQNKSGLSEGEVAIALKQLDSSKIFKNTAWGGQSTNFAHPDNLWTIRI